MLNSVKESSHKFSTSYSDEYFTNSKKDPIQSKINRFENFDSDQKQFLRSAFQKNSDRNHCDNRAPIFHSMDYRWSYHETDYHFGGEHVSRFQSR